MAFIIPTDPSEIIIEDFARKYGFRFRNEGYNFRIWDENNRKVYTFPLFFMSPNQILKLMCLIVELRNIKKTWLEEKDFYKRRKIYSKGNYIRGELNKYER